MKDSRSSLGKQLRQHRSQVGLGIKGVAKKAGVSYTYLSKIENDLKIPSPGLISKLCAIYSVDPDDLIAEIGELPKDIQKIVKDHGKDAFDLLRKTYSDST